MPTLLLFWPELSAFGGASGARFSIVDADPFDLVPASPSAVPARMPPEPRVDWLTLAGAK